MSGGNFIFDRRFTVGDITRPSCSSSVTFSRAARISRRSVFITCSLLKSSSSVNTAETPGISPAKTPAIVRKGSHFRAGLASPLIVLGPYSSYEATCR